MRSSRGSCGPGSSVNDGSRYFGPYAAGSSVDESMDLFRRLFPFRTCKIDIDGRRPRAATAVPALSPQALPGPVRHGHTKNEYRKDIEQGELFLEGR